MFTARVLPLLALVTVFTVHDFLRADEIGAPTPIASSAATPAIQVAQLQPGEKPQAGATPKTRTIRGRLPNNYGKLGISQKQRTEIYGIQSKYSSQLEELEKQIAALRAQRDAEVEAVLTPEQKKVLAELTAASAEKRSAEKTTASE